MLPNGQHLIEVHTRLADSLSEQAETARLNMDSDRAEVLEQEAKAARAAAEEIRRRMQQADKAFA